MPPPLLLGLIIATMYGSACHALFGRRIWQWPLFWAASVSGFFAGYAAGIALGIEWVRIGSMPLLGSTLGALFALWLSWFFSAPYAASRPDPDTGKRTR